MVEGARGKGIRCLGPPPSALRAATSPCRGGFETRPSRTSLSPSRLREGLGRVFFFFFLDARLSHQKAKEDPHPTLSAGVVRCHNTDKDRLNPLFVHHLIGQKVKDCSVEPFCLTLTFERDTLRIYSNDGPYECGQIYDDANRLTVF